MTGYVVGEQRISHLGFETELVAGISGHGAAVGARHAVEDRVRSVRRTIFRIGVVDREICVVAAHDLAVRAQAFHKCVRHEAARLRHHVDRQTGHLRHAAVERLGRDALRARGGHGHQIVRHGEFFRLGQRGRAESILALERKNAFSPAALAEAEKFAMTDYLVTMAAAGPQGVTAKAFYGRVAQMTGLPVDVVTQARGFVADAFVKSLRPDGKIVSRYDANFAVDDPYPENRSAHGPDPILDGVSRAYGGAMAAYARNELGFKTEMTYALLANDVTGHWDWQGGRMQASAEDDLRTLLAFNPSFRLLIAHGLSDMVTPYGMTRYVLDHLPQADAPGRTQLKLYRGGHMVYLDAQSRKAFSADAATFYRSAE